VTKDIGPIDILVNNAGITKDTTFKKMSKADWDAVIRTNLDSVFNMTKQVMDGMTDRGLGASKLTSRQSTARRARWADQLFGRQGRHARLHQGPGPGGGAQGVTVNTISPGYIGTKMVTAIPKEVLDSKILPQISAWAPRRTRTRSSA
jgi:acetoacetyl-CoA reductase